MAKLRVEIPNELESVAKELGKIIFVIFILKP